MCEQVCLNHEGQQEWAGAMGREQVRRGISGGEGKSRIVGRGKELLVLVLVLVWEWEGRVQFHQAMGKD